MADSEIAPELVTSAKAPGSIFKEMMEKLEITSLEDPEAMIEIIEDEPKEPEMELHDVLVCYVFEGTLSLNSS